MTNADGNSWLLKSGMVLMALLAVSTVFGQVSVAIPAEGVRLLNGWWGCVAEKVRTADGRTEIVCQSD
ncbi:MAG: hypothetical protein KBT68_08770, partial [bacterium]|nr:hypothetical protein [Candidatus Colisoma equi]